MNLFEKLAKEREPINILHGTDWWTDCDDIAALRLLCKAHKAGAIRLQCVCANAVMEHTAASIDAFLMNDGVQVPVGIDKSFNMDPNECRYQFVLKDYPHRIVNSDCDEAYRVYRRALAELDGKADITEVGFPQIIHQLMTSEPDDISPLNGMELVRQKVNKIWLMAGRWDQPNSKEFNICHTKAGREASDYIFRNSPVPVTCLGWEIGKDVITGNTAKENDPLKIAYNAHGSGNGRPSWDPMLVLLAIINDEEMAGYNKVCGQAYVNTHTGENNFTEGKGNCAYVVRKFDNGYYSEMINELINSEQ